MLQKFIINFLHHNKIQNALYHITKLTF